MNNFIYILLITATGLLIGFLTEKLLRTLKIRKARKKATGIIAGAGDNEEIKTAEYKKKMQEVEKYRNQLKKSIGSLKKKIASQEKRTDSLEKRLSKRTTIASNLKEEISEMNSLFSSRRKKNREVIQERLLKLEKKASVNREEIVAALADDLLSETKLACKKMKAGYEKIIEGNQEQIARRTISDTISRVNLPAPTSVPTASLKFPDEDAYIRFQKFYEKYHDDIIETIDSGVRFEEKRQAAIIENMEPVQKEIAYRTLNNIIQQKKFDFKLINKGVNRYKNQVENEKLRAAKMVLRRAGIKEVPDEILSLLGVLQFRTSFGQPQLLHSLEVCRLATLLAAELGADVKLARRAGLLHDIGKAVDRQRESGHALIGAEIAEEAGEHEVVINSIGSHHNDMEATAVESLIVAAADAISGSRPGARQENITNYSERIDNLRKLASKRRGIKKVYIMNAGRELRVWVNHNQISDDQLPKLAHDIASDIEEEMIYSGEIKINTIRRTRFTRTAHT
ncbi:MAG: HDIG domain-containing metalloprotein [bacterium]